MEPIAAECFAKYIAAEPDAYNVSPEEAADIIKAVEAFRKALAVSVRKFSRTQRTIMDKDVARRNAEQIIRMFANIIRADSQVSFDRKRLLRLKQRPAKLKARKCPKHPPRLLFVGSGDGTVGGIANGSGSGVHVLKFLDGNDSVPVHASSDIGKVRPTKPDGAVRRELYFDMVPPGDPRGGRASG